MLLQDYLPIYLEPDFSSHLSVLRGFSLHCRMWSLQLPFNQAAHQTHLLEVPSTLLIRPSVHSYSTAFDMRLMHDLDPAWGMGAVLEKIGFPAGQRQAAGGLISAKSGRQRFRPQTGSYLRPAKAASLRASDPQCGRTNRISKPDLAVIKYSRERRREERLAKSRATAAVSR